MSRSPLPQPAKEPSVFISYRSQDPDMSLAQTFHHALEEAGYSTFMAAESISWGEKWAGRIDAALEQCEFFLLLLSKKSAVSEMVTEEVRRAKELRDRTGKPMILPIRVNFPMEAELNYDLRGYLQPIQQRQWQGEQDTEAILKELLALITSPPIRPSGGVEEFDPPAISQTLMQQESIQIPPLPVAEPELPGGQVDLASQFYVERGTIERRCYDTIATPGALIRIKAPRQMGKTSLMSRILRHSEQRDCLGVTLSFQIADSVVFAMVGGHPYLVRLALYHIARGDISLEALLQEAPTEAMRLGREYRESLRSPEPDTQD